MNNKLMVLIGMGGVLLLLILMGEWFYGKEPPKVTPPVIKQQALDEMPSINLLAKTELSFADLVNRPLFIKGRKPAPEHSITPISTEKFDWQLSGIYTSQKKNLYALLSRVTKKATPKDNYFKITEGNELDGWKLTEIHTDKIIFQQGAVQKELLLRKPKPKLPAAKAGIPDPSIPVSPENMPLDTSAPPNMQAPDMPSPEAMPEPPQPTENPFENNNAQF